MLWISRHVMLRELPAKRVVIQFELLGPDRRYFWLVLRAGEASLCPKNPGFPEDVYVSSTLEALYRLVVGQQSLKQAMERPSEWRVHPDWSAHFRVGCSSALPVRQ